MHTLLQDVRHALRVLARHRVLTLSALSTLTLAIAANTAIFTLVSGVLLTPLSLPEPDRIVRIEEQHAHRPGNLTGATFTDLRDRSRSFDGVAAYRLTTPGFSSGDAPEQVLAAEVSQDYLLVLGVPPALGRQFVRDDFLSGARPAVVIGDDLWRRGFGADPQAIGRRVLVNAVPMEIIGVMPRRFGAPGAPQIWLPSPAASPLLRNRRAHLFTVIARLKQDAGLSPAQQELSAVARQIAGETGSTDPDMTLTLTRLQERTVAQVRPSLLMLWGAVGLVLLVGAANIANLLLMLGSSRSRELAIRAALGAGRARLVRQFVTESMVLGVAGGLAGTLLGVWAVPLLTSVLPSSVPRTADIAVDARVITFAVLLSLATALVFGLVPALRASIRPAGDDLRDRQGEGRSSSRLRAGLVASEVAVAVMLLGGAGLLARSFAAVTAVNVGFDPSNVISFGLTLPAARYPDAAAHAAFLERVATRIAALPGVSAVGATGALVMSGTPATTMQPEGAAPDTHLTADVITASPGFFPALRIPLLRGRLISNADARGAQPVMLISETAARRFWPDGRDPVGRYVTMQDWGAPYQAEVIGVVGDVRQARPDSDVHPAVYYPVAQFPETLLRNSVVIRTAGDPMQIVAAAREQVRAIDRDQPVALIRTLDQVLGGATAERRFNMMLLGAFSIAAVLLAAIGIYGVVAFAMARRTREIGVRMALGARRRDIVRLTLAEGATPVALGLTVGLAGAAMGSRAIEGLLFGVPARDPITLGGVTALLAFTAVVACLIPARRALRIDPAIALRHE
jgi:putative ABC transport system permease protein